MNGVREIGEAEFEQAVIQAELPVLVDFYAPWCGPCRALAPALEGVAKTYEGRLEVVKVNVDDAPQLAHNYRVRGVPTLMIFQGGKAADTMVGIPPLNALKNKLNAVTAPSTRVGVCGCCA